MTERYVLMGLGGPRAAWFGRVSRWATEAVIPADFVKTISAEEVRSRLTAGRRCSAVLLDATAPTVDRDLLGAVADAGAVAIVVTDPRVPRSWTQLGAHATLPDDFDRSELMAVLAAHASVVVPVVPPLAAQAIPSVDIPSWQCPIVAVTGAAGTGRSVIAVATAQGLVPTVERRPVLLADLALDADLAMLLDAGDVVPGLPELVDAHRLGHPDPVEVRSMTFALPERGFDLLAGLRHPADWVTLRANAVAASITSLRRTYRTVVADVDPALDSVAADAAPDIRDRNAAAVSTLSAAAVVVVVGRAGLQGLHRHLRVLTRVHDLAPDGCRIVPVVNGCVRRSTTAAETREALAAWATAVDRETDTPVFTPQRRGLDERLRDGGLLPGRFVRPIGTAVRLALTTATPASSASTAIPVHPGELGHLHPNAEPA